MTDVVNVGTFANDPSADPLRSAFQKVNAKFQALDAGGVGSGAVLLTDLGDGLTAWQAAAALVSAGEIGQIVIPTKRDDQIGIARAALSDPLAGLITFTQNLSLRVEGPVTLEFDYIGTPLFCFAGLTAGGISGRPKFRFTGTTPLTAPVSRAAYSAASGFNNASWSGGGDYELWSLILSNSSGMDFGDIDFESAAPNDETHVLPFVARLLPPNATTRATGNHIGRLRARDIVFGMLYGGQDGLVVDEMDCDRRAGLSQVAPGHVAYCGGPVMGDGYTNINCRIDGIYDGPNAINWPASKANNLATISPKFMTKCAISRVRSFHPNGIIQALQTSDKNDFVDWVWRSDDAEPVSSPVVNAVGTNTGNAFEDFTLIAPNKTVTVAGVSGGLSANTFKSWWIESNPDLGLAAPAVGWFDFDGSSNELVDIHIKPTNAVTGGHTTQYAVSFRGTGTGNRADVTFHGDYVTPAMRRAVDAGGGSNFAILRSKIRADDTPYLNNDMAGMATSFGTFVLTNDEETHWHLGDDGGGSGATTKTFKVWGRGAYVVHVAVQSAGRTDAVSGLFDVQFFDLAVAENDVQQRGTTVTKGALLSALALSTDKDGLLTVSYTKGSANFCDVSVSARRVGHFT